MRTIAVLSMSLWLSGCMMLGMGGLGMGGGMHGTPGGRPAGGPTIIKESVANGMRMTVEFPPYRPGDRLVYTVTLQDATSGAAVAGASMALLVSPVAGPAQDSIPGQARAHAMHEGSPTEARGATTAALEFAADEVGDGKYVFRPSLTTAAAHRFRFVLKRSGTPGLDPPNELEHVVQLGGAGDQHAGSGAPSSGWGVTPLILLGAGAMAVAMLIMLR